MPKLAFRGGSLGMEKSRHMQLRRRLLVGLFAALVVGCASGSGGAPRAPRKSDPVLISSMRPDLRYPQTRVSGTMIDMRIQVDVDATGAADIETLRVTGPGTGENLEIISSWLRAARFKPAQQGGQAVRGTFRTRIEARAEVRRVG